MRNIRESYKIPKIATCNLGSIDEWVNEIQQSESNPILLFKQQDTESNIKGLNYEDFCLIVMTDNQKSILQQHGNTCVCFDSTSLRECDFALTTMAVLDGNQMGVPVAFLFSNKHDTMIYNVFFEVLKLHFGVLTPHVLMTDNTEFYYIAWQTVMGETPNRLLNTWHVIRNWERKLYLVKSVEKQRNILERLKMCQALADKNTFCTMFETLLQELQDDPLTKPYGDYLLSEYVTRIAYWATCYTQQLGLRSNISFECIRKIFKNNYREGKKDKKLDKPLRALVEFAVDKPLLLSKRQPKGKTKLHIIRNRHKESLLCGAIIHAPGTDGNMVWLIQRGLDDTGYEVKHCADCACKLRCKECDTCIHAFSCTCHDYVIKGNMCVHVHQVCLIQNNPKTYLEAENIPNHLEFQIIEVSEEMAVEVTASTEIVEEVEIDNTELELQCEQEKVQRIEALKIGFTNFLESGLTLDHVDIVERGVKSIIEQCLSPSLDVT